MKSMLFHIPAYKNIDDIKRAVGCIECAYKYAISRVAPVRIFVLITYTGSESEFAELRKAVDMNRDFPGFNIAAVYNGAKLGAVDNWNKFITEIDGYDYYIPHHADNYIDHAYIFEVINKCPDVFEIIIPSYNSVNGSIVRKVIGKKKFTNWILLGSYLLLKGSHLIPIECVYPVSVIKRFSIYYRKCGNLAWCSDFLFFIDVARRCSIATFSPTIITNFTLGRADGVTALAKKPMQRDSIVSSCKYCIQDFNVIGFLIFIKMLIRSYL
jgi:hypothetical protein